MLPRLFDPPPWWAWMLFLSAVCALALWRGGRTERVGAAILFAAWLGSLLLNSHRWGSPQWGILAVDGAMFLALTALALRSDRWWPMAAAGFQLLSILTHAAKAVDSALGPWAYFMGGMIWSYLVLAALAVGAVNAWRRRLAEAPDRPQPD